jgi:hypothetical protein
MESAAFSLSALAGPTPGKIAHCPQSSEGEWDYEIVRTFIANEHIGRFSGSNYVGSGS